MHAVCYEVTGAGHRLRRHGCCTSSPRPEAGDEAETVACMCQALADDRLDVPFAAVYLAADDAQLRRSRLCRPGRGALYGRRKAAARGCRRDRRRASGQPHGRSRHRRGRPFPGRRPGRRAARRARSRPDPNLALARAPRLHELMGAQFAGAVAPPPSRPSSGRKSLAELDRAKRPSSRRQPLRTPLALLLGPIGDVLNDPAAPLPEAVRAAQPGPAQRAAPAATGERPARLRQHRGGAVGTVQVETDLAAFTRDWRASSRPPPSGRAAADRGLPPLERDLRRPADV